VLVLVFCCFVVDKGKLWLIPLIMGIKTLRGRSSDDSYPTSPTKKAISIAAELGLERSWQNWKANSKIYKVMF
jgi:hypothetical protein